MKPTLAMLAAITLVGCGAGAPSGSSADLAATRVASSPASAQAKSGFDAPSEGANASLATRPRTTEARRAVIRSGSLAVRVGDLEKSERAAGEIIARLEGYVDSAESSDLAGKKPVLTLTARIPESAFEQALRAFEGLGTRLSKRIAAQDVTGDIADNTARLATMRAHEESLRNVLKRAGDTNSIMEAQRRLAEARMEIEGLQARLDSVKGQAALSTIELRLEQSAEASAVQDPRWGAEAWASASTSAMNSFRIVVGAALWMLAYAPLWIVGALVYRALRARRKTRPTWEPAP